MSWRLLDQEEYLKEKKLLKIDILKYKQKIKNPLFFHEHCEFCFDNIEKLEEGYCSRDFYRWICPTCYRDFLKEFAFEEVKYEYFLLRHEISGTIYHEFKMGKYAGKHWNNNSLFLSEDIMEDIQLNKIFEDNIPKYNYFGFTKINKNQWKKIIDSLEKYSAEIQKAILEITEWVEYSLEKYKCFTILGI